LKEMAAKIKLSQHFFSDLVREITDSTLYTWTLFPKSYKYDRMIQVPVTCETFMQQSTILWNGPGCTEISLE
jgi:hypothetical protein